MASHTIPLILDNQPVITADTFDVINPNTGAVVYKCSSTSVADAVHAADSANAAFKSWAKVKPAARQDIFLKVIEIYERRKEELIGYAQEETGSSRFFTEFNWGLGLGLLKTNAMFVLGLRSIVLPLAAGNTVVLKASELSPKCFWALGDIFREAQLPAGCLNVLYHRPTSAAEITTALIAHPAIRKINFTGSTQVGRIIAATAGKYIKPVLLELGGKTSTIVLDDADLKKAVTGCVMGSFLHGGQICMATERIIVQRSVVDDFRNHLRETVAAYNPDPAPVLVNSAPVIKNRNLVSNAVSKGANILIGDNSSSEDIPNNTRMHPIVLENITPDMDIYQTESFGPTVSLFVVDTEEEAIQLANDTEYGLSAAVYTENLGRGLRIARQLESGAVHINSMTVHDEPGLPHGGVKSSGFSRFSSPTGLDEFLTTKSVTWMDV
ncbi:NAD-dependent aldehyde dehydrogenase [[Emmonsia] crescens]|uniref:NAD-dependent aldehyde dehydrogenase n=1 Tax=[Emmonsia] crescens TaxID=73230 RepID=A0A0G2IZ09_9EURO|nr:NAD-dependent aldehyde dehydrogenase [Emmonsia crescens UAMH 3008]